VTLDPQRRQALLEAKLGALVRERAAGALVVPEAFAGGAGAVVDGQAWVLAEDRPARALGPALAWARQRDVVHVQLIAEEATGLLARRAMAFHEPPTVWRLTGRQLDVAAPEPLVLPPPIDARALAFASIIRQAGASVTEEHGVLAGEVAGLEVCRVVIDPDLDEARLEVGVGAHDREAFRLVHGDRPAVEALAAVVDGVARYRRPGAPPHALNRLAAERLLRDRLVEQPSLVGLHQLEPAPPPLPRSNLKDPVPCVATGADGLGQAVVVVCSVGVDLDLVPFATDARLAVEAADGAERRLVLAVPERDLHPVTLALAGRLLRPADVAGVPPA
jgi:hypothetical protein